MRPTIVCAEADASLGEIHARALEQSGCRVVRVHDGEHAHAAADQEGVDLLIVDALLARLGGFEVIEILRESDGPGRALPAVVLAAGRLDPGSRRRAELLGDVALLAKPVPLELLLHTVGTLLKTSGSSARLKPSPSAAASRAPATSLDELGAMPLAGSLREVHFGALLHALHGARAGGVLILDSGKKKKAIGLREGYPVSVKSNLVTECLGNLLARRGFLSQEVLDESLRRVKRGDGLQGEILVAMQVVDEETVANALAEQAEGKLLEIFEWKRGRYAFQKGKKLERANTLSLSGTPASLILQGARRHVPIERVDDFLVRHGSTHLALTESPFDRFQSFDLSEDETSGVAALDLGRKLADFLDAPERVRRILYALALTEVLVPSESAQPVGSERAASSPRAARADAGQDDPALRRELTALAQSLRDKNHYEVLGLPTIADDGAVRAAYAKQIERVHPDRYRASSGAVRQVADEIYRLFTRAYESIRDAESRAAYAVELKRDLDSQRDDVRSRTILSAEQSFQRGETAMRQRDYEGALVFFGSALERLPEEGLYHAYYGWCLHLCHPDNEVIVQEAIEHIQQGIKLARDHETPCLFLGRLYKVMGKMAAAEKMFTRAVQLRADCVEALRELRLLNMRRDKKRGLIGRILKKP